MIPQNGLPFIKEYISSINTVLQQKEPGVSLSRLQCAWITFVLMGILITNSLCWSRFARFGLGAYQPAAMSWMFRKSQIVWSYILEASVRHLLVCYGITYGYLQLDDSDIQRSKQTPRIAKTHKVKDKKTNGFVNGQNILFLVLVAKDITIPVGFRFYCPDPALTAWYKEDKRLRAKKVKKKYRPVKPPENPRYPSKKALALVLIKQFNRSFLHIKIHSINADLFYGTSEFMDGVLAIYPKSQVISQVKGGQLCSTQNKKSTLKELFQYYIGRKEQLSLRTQNKQVTYVSLALKIKSHGKKYRVVACKYEGETEFRYLIATDMTWLAADIIRAYSLRWLVEVFIQDWKTHAGWNKLAKQQGEIGSDRGVILSLMVDHALLLHGEQLDLYNLPMQLSPLASIY